MRTHSSTAGEGFELNSPDAKVMVKVDAAHTDGAYELFEVDAPRGPTVPPHVTPWAKAYYVLHGRMAVLVDGEVHDLTPGSSIAIPPDAAHTFTVHSPSVRFLAISLTDAMGRFFRDVDRSVPAGTPLHDAAPLLREVVERHGITMGEWSS
ncbi:cupin domain-containing protein [Saccharothrix sp. S26]|uniref:cupin domain-containing protein n=1 Tax=Saccharothrix sp. S26 TaxID=2907215 RepID=UPI001F41A749|nr:cupin domain-containing protein [Saccharothrix sp. S26]MCE6995202.1 cupin domain-containing protein [Saccharothrix sp. S26]